MTTYYISPSGNDANNGLGPDASHGTNKPWLTIGKALGAAGIASGDTVYIGPGSYRETVAVAMTSATGETSIIGDPTNAQGFKTGAGVLVAPGEVIWTAYTTNDTTAPASAILLNLSGRDFLTLQYLTLIGGSASPSCVGAGTTHSINITLRDCKIISSHISTANVVYTGLADSAANWVIDRCKFFGYSGNAIALTLPTSASADYDINFQITNCEFNAAGATAISIGTSGAAAFKAGGVDVNACIFNVRLSALLTGANMATSIPCTVLNSLLICPGGPALSANASGQITEDWNRIISTTPRTNVSAGTNSVDNFTHAVMLDLGFSEMIGAYRRQYWSPMTGSPLLGFGGSGVPAVDILNRPRPAGGASLSSAVGAYERHNTGAQETSVVHAGSSGLKIVGPGDHDVQVPVDASSTTLTIYARYDSTHDATNKPQVILLANGTLGVSGETKTMTAAADTWEQLTFSSFTPTAKGVVILRLVSRSAGAAGIAYFDTAAGGASSTAGFDYFKGDEPIPVLVAGAAGGGGAGGGIFHSGVFGEG